MGRLLEQKVALVTGGSSGIGRAAALRFAQEGARVVVSDVQDEAGQAVVERIRADGGTAAFVRCDILREEDLRALVAAAVGAYGRLDVFMANAMVTAARTALEATAEEFERAMAGMPRAAFLACKYAIPRMVGGGGAIVFSSSVHGTLPARNSLGYEVGKAALFNLCRQVTVDYGPQGIRANAICPGGVQSRLDDGAPTPRTRYGREIYPARRLGRPLDVANACLSLASDEASRVTGQVLAVDGGLTSQLQDDLAYRLRGYLKEHPEALA